MNTKDRLILEHHKYLVRNTLKKLQTVERKMEKLSAVTGDPDQNIRTQRFWQSESQYDVLQKERDKYYDFLQELNFIRNFTNPAPIIAKDYHFVHDYQEIIDRIKYY